MKLIDLDLLKGKVEAMQACEPHYANNFLNDALNPSTEWGCIEDMIDSIPVIDAQPVKRGKWEYQENMPFESCNICRYRNYDPVYTPNFCPNCGAKMDGGAE